MMCAGRSQVTLENTIAVTSIILSVDITGEILNVVIDLVGIGERPPVSENHTTFFKV